MTNIVLQTSTPDARSTRLVTNPPPLASVMPSRVLAEAITTLWLTVAGCGSLPTPADPNPAPARPPGPAETPLPEPIGVPPAEPQNVPTPNEPIGVPPTNPP